MSTGFGHLSLPELEDEDFIDDEIVEEDDFETESDSDDSAAEETGSRDDEPADDWEARFKGLQASHQQTVEELRAQLNQTQQLSQQQLAGMQAQLFRQQIAELEPEEQAAAWSNFEAAVRNQQIIQGLQSREQQIRQAEQFVNERAREVAAYRIANSYQVPAETLMKFDSPEEMLEVAKIAKSKRAKQASRKKRQSEASRRTRFEGGTAPGRQKRGKKPATLSEAKAMFASLPTPTRQR